MSGAMLVCAVETPEGVLSLWASSRAVKRWSRELRRNVEHSRVGDLHWKLNGKRYDKNSARDLLGHMAYDGGLGRNRQLQHHRKRVLAYIAGEPHDEINWRQSLCVLVQGGLADDLAICSVACDRAHRLAIGAPL